MVANSEETAPSDDDDAWAAGPGEDLPPRRRPTKRERRQAFALLCHMLSATRADGAAAMPAAESFEWVTLIDLANRHRVVGTLATAADRKGWPIEPPADVVEYLSLVREAQAEHNRAIRRQVRDLAGTLAAAGIPFALLKGANWLVEAAEAELGERLLADIDLVVAADGWEAALAALADAGYRPATDAAIYEKHFHHVPLARREDAVTIELHRHLGWQRHLLTPGEVVVAAEPAAGAPELRLCSPAHRLVFGSMHAQLQNMEYAARRFSLRDLWDIQQLLARHGDRIDWMAVAALARGRGLEAYLAASLHLAHRTLGVGLPAVYAADRRAARHAARCLALQDSELGSRASALAVKLAWVLDNRRHSYELDCERSPWPVRQARVAGSRALSVLQVLAGRKRRPVPLASNE
jgi:hypothetical protein